MFLSRDGVRGGRERGEEGKRAGESAKVRGCRLSETRGSRKWREGGEKDRRESEGKGGREREGERYEGGIYRGRALPSPSLSPSPSSRNGIGNCK